MTTYYSSGTINIPNVTGDIVITATAVPAVVSSISAVFVQGDNVIYDTDTLDDLKQYLTVTATYEGGITAVVTDYTLSGTLTVGTSTITATYMSKTDTFSVTVTERTLTYRHIWDFTQSMVDTVGGVEATKTSYTTQDSSGLHLTQASSGCLLGANVFPPGRVAEITFSSTAAAFASSSHGRFVMINSIANPTITSTEPQTGFIYRSTGAWAFYKGGWSSASAVTDKDAFNGKKLIMKYYYSDVDSKYHTDVYADDSLVLAYSSDTKWNTNADSDNLYIGSRSQTFYAATVTTVKIYDYEE